MTDDRNQAYLALGRLIASLCPPGFETARLHLESDGEERRLRIDAALPDGTEVRLQPGGADASQLLERLDNIRDAMAREDGATWRNCVVTLRAGGHFAMDVE